MSASSERDSILLGSAVAIVYGSVAAAVAGGTIGTLSSESYINAANKALAPEYTVSGLSSFLVQSGFDGTFLFSVFKHLDEVINTSVAYAALFGTSSSIVAASILAASLYFRNGEDNDIPTGS